MKKKVLILIIATLMLILHTCGMAYAKSYDRTIDYRYKFGGQDNNYNYYGSNWVEWRQDRDVEFSDSNTDQIVYTRVDNQSVQSIVTNVDVITHQSGEFNFKGTRVAGDMSTQYLTDINVDYIYQYQSSTVDVDYTISFTFNNPSSVRYNYINVEVYGITRIEPYGYNLLSTYLYRPNADHANSQYAYGETVTLTGNDGYNYKGFVMRIVAQCVDRQVKINGTDYKLWSFTTSLDTITPEVDYGEQLDNINGTLGSIYSSITGGFTTVVNAITNISSGILNGIEHLFVYDDWQEDLESITNKVSIPYIQDLTAAFADITSIFNTYYPDDTIDVKIKNPMYTQHGGREYMVNTTYSLETPLSVGIGGYTFKQLFHIISGLFVLAYFVKIVTKLMSMIGIRFDEIILPWIREVIHR